MASHHLVLALVVSLLSPDATQAFFWNWLGWRYPTTSSSGSTSSASTTSSGSTNTASNYALSIGNRLNTNANVTDYGTMLSNININLMARFNGNATSGDTSTSLLDDAVLGVAEAYRNELTRVTAERLAWFSDQIAEAVRSANDVHQRHISDLVGVFANETRAGVRGLSEPTRGCLNRSVEVADVIRSVQNRSESGCLQGKIERMLDLEALASGILTDFSENQQDVDDRLEICVDLQDDFDEEMSDFHKLACVSTTLLDVQAEMAKLELTVEQLTAEAGVTMRQLKAGLLECVADVANYALDASLKLRHWINVCSAKQ